MSTIEELKIWLDLERVNTKLCANDPLLLEIATAELAELRSGLINSEEHRAEYTDMYKTLTDLLYLRVDKFARGMV